MSARTKRVFGTTPTAISKAEQQLGFALPPSFRMWLLENNGLKLKGVHVFPVLDERDVRQTWDSIARHFDNGRWFPEYFEEDGLKADHLLPFASCESGDLYCFDYTRKREDGEVPIVWWSHETAETKDKAGTFSEFAQKAEENLIDD